MTIPVNIIFNPISLIPLAKITKPVKGNTTKSIRKTLEERNKEKQFNNTYFQPPIKTHSPELKKKGANDFCNFVKVITVAKHVIELKFFRIPPASPILFNDKFMDNLEENERTHKLKFDKVKLGIDQVNNMNPKLPFGLKSTLIFVFDLSNFESFKKLQIYYEELDKQFDIARNHFRVLIGNKVDKKKPFNREQEELLNNFKIDNSLKYYEITTKMICNFEKLFETMFFELYMDCDDFFKSTYFQERFNHVLNFRQT